MADLVVHRSADRLGVRSVARWSVIERRGNGALHVYHVFVAKLVEFAGRHARFYVRRNEVQHFGGQPAGDAHFCDVFAVFNGNGHDN